MSLTARVFDALSLVQDPIMLETIVDLGLVYTIEASRAGDVTVWMTLTTPHHPRADEIVRRVREAVLAQPGVAAVDVRLVWDEQQMWTPYRMADHLKATLGLPAQEPPIPAAPAPPSRFRQAWSRLVRRNSA